MRVLPLPLGLPICTLRPLNVVRVTPRKVDLIGRYSNSPELPELGNTPLFRVVRSLTHGSTTPNNDLAQKPSPSSISVDGPWPGSAATTDEPTRSFATYSSAVASCAAA